MRVSAEGLISLLLLFRLIIHVDLFLRGGGGSIQKTSCHGLNDLRRVILIEK